MTTLHAYDQPNLTPLQFIQAVAADRTVNIVIRCRAWDHLALIGDFSLAEYVADVADLLPLADALAAAFGHSRLAADATVLALKREYGSAMVIAAIKLCDDLHGPRVLQ
jgi:hypothetical protein